MKKTFISIFFGLIGAAAFLLGAASSSGENFVITVIPAKLLQYAVLNWGLALDDVQLNKWSVIVQFLGYYIVVLILLQLKNVFTRKT